MSATTLRLPSSAADAPNRSDAELLTAWQSGEDAAFAGLVARHGGLVRAACMRQAPRNEVDDCVQAVFLVLSRRPAAAAACPSLAAWLLRVASYVCRRAQRSVLRRKRAETCSVVSAPTVIRPAATLPEDAISHLDACLLCLPERQRLAVVMRYLSGRSPEDIAVALGVTRNNAYQLLNRGMVRLRDLFERRGVAIEAAALLALLGMVSESAAAEAAAAIQPAGLAVSAPTALAKAHASGAEWASGISTISTWLLVAGLALATLAVALLMEPTLPAPSEIDFRIPATTPAVATKTIMPAADWHPLLADRGLDGWEIHRGTWSNSDGVLRAATVADNGARIRTAASYGDLDLRCRMRVSGTAEIQLGDYSVFFSVLSTDGRWSEIRLSHRDGAVICTADGVALPLESETGETMPRIGPLAFHGHFGSVEIADLFIRAR
ncbi:MAG: sigma-70 family RNA polymerase sigma factor [Planctomycetes bacterium]|nr:sigma-70 family RNA polymerase sigma factor [Planctomycetota bacterium]